MCEATGGWDSMTADAGSFLRSCGSHSRFDLFRPPGGFVAWEELPASSATSSILSIQKWVMSSGEEPIALFLGAVAF